MKSRRRPKASTPSPDCWPASAKQQLAELLHRLPPICGCADWHSNDAKCVRITVPKTYRDALNRFDTTNAKSYQRGDSRSDYERSAALTGGVACIVCSHPDNRLCVAPSILGERLVEEIKGELKAQGLAECCSQVEILWEEVKIDAKGRCRISHMLTDPVGIKGKVVFWKRGWRIEIWAREELEKRVKVPPVAPAFPDLPCGSKPTPGSPGTIDCG